MAIRSNRAAIKLNGVKVFVYMPVRRNCHGESLFAWLQSRFMTTSKRVRDRSSMKRVHDLEIVTEKMKITSKVLAIMEILQEEPEMVIPEQERLIEEYSDRTAEHVTRCLMMSANRRLRLDKIANLRRDFGLPLDFRKKWVRKYPELFKVVSVPGDEVGYLELLSWNPVWVSQS